ncbi:hemerythrin domain-containing protein [Streptacidiphilus monticola]|uniref:Hemerythrin domain-containing protein n=1 Tax=Streptacidiphilus monticola TaxID=2161674 RepID=A0ABW1G3N3_9ACTN
MGADLLHELAADHVALTNYTAALQGTPLGHPERRVLVQGAARLLAAHAAAEEAYLYPLLRTLPGGDKDAADAAQRRTAQMEAVLRELDRLDVHSPQFDRLVAQFTELASAHQRGDEANLYPVVKSCASTQQLSELGERARELKAEAGRTHVRTEPPADTYQHGEPSLGEKLRLLFTNRGGWQRWQPR